YDAKRMAARHLDHSLYIAFAPADKPKIAIAIIVENGGFGVEAAAPIVRKALDYYLLGKRPQDKERKDPQPLPKPQSDMALYRSDTEVKAPAEPEPGPKPGGET
ncbi:penicillin-binding protein 2, partial [Undibacterium sp. LFS511W]|nr:penicillin-binding protein 2 [Undibacterium luofuense]